jgi:hypothetical protein
MPDAAVTPPLPDDAPTLKRMVGELLDTLRDQRRENEQLRSRLDQLLRRIYGPRSERINPDQPLLFDAVPGEPTPRRHRRSNQRPNRSAMAVTAGGSSPRTCRGSGSSTT